MTITLRKMIPMVSFLAALRILTEAQSCNNGIGKLVYEKVSGYKLVGGGNEFGGGRSRSELVTRKDLPTRVLEECIRRCQEDRTTSIQECLSFDFFPGKPLSFSVPGHRTLSETSRRFGDSESSSNQRLPGGSYNNDRKTAGVDFNNGENYEESKCYLYHDRASPDGTNTLIAERDAWHFNEVCLSSAKVSTECADQLYVFERTPGYKFERDDDNEVFASDRTECQDKCLNEYNFVCRSATFDRAGQKCRISRGTKYTAPDSFRQDSNSDYMENMCLSGRTESPRGSRYPGRGGYGGSYGGYRGGGRLDDRSDYGGGSGGWGENRWNARPYFWSSYPVQYPPPPDDRYGGSFGIDRRYPAPYPPGPRRPPNPGVYPVCPPGGVGEGRPFHRLREGLRITRFYIRRVLQTDRIEECERACLEARDFICRSFNYRPFAPDNCELSDIDLSQLRINNPSHFDQNTQFDYFERDGFGPGGGNCLDVTQSCSPDGMEFSLRTPGGFFGRIYTYGFFETCFYDGNGGNVNVLKISRANGFPRCGTQQYSDVMTNIVVVQFNDYVQTSHDKVYNLTCYLAGPGETVVTSNYMDSRTDGRYPTQIEHLPAQNILTSSVTLRILYRGTPTNTIAVGDLLTFRLETRSQYRYDYFTGDIFATYVIAKDPYSGRQVHLIDSRGCPVDLYVFPELHRTPEGALEADFYAFKIPGSNLLVFQATVRTCRGPCEPVICSDRGRPGSFPSWGRKKRAVSSPVSLVTPVAPPNSTDSIDHEEEVHELLKVYLSRSDIPAVSKGLAPERWMVCVPKDGYYTLMFVMGFVVFITIAIAVAAVSYIRRIKTMVKESDAESTSPSTTEFYISEFQAPKFEDPSEPIYTDQSMFERSRSLRSMTISNLGNVIKAKGDFY
ncbi:uncharacterized protein LOC143248450 isoform X2 [Tachypleus tridentatus]|uniref:uncharacterized protein LOC143248450 isoform X2 n=1 Tax=Tachypleus tridentatus TaxID=6853 RepID=UPI003FD202F6